MRSMKAVLEMRGEKQKISYQRKPLIPKIYVLVIAVTIRVSDHIPL